MKPWGSVLEEGIVKQDDDVNSLKEQKILPGRCLSFRVKENPHSLDELPRLDDDTRSDG